MNDVNEVKLQGRLLKPPKRYLTKTGRSVCHFILRVDRRGREGYENISCTAWGDLAEIVCGALPGQTINIPQGHIEVSKFVKGDNTEWRAEVVAEQLEALEPAPSEFDSFGPPPEDIPF